MAQALNVSVDDLVGTNGIKKRGAGPTGKDEQLRRHLSAALSTTEARRRPRSLSLTNTPHGECVGTNSRFKGKFPFTDFPAILSAL